MSDTGEVPPAEDTAEEAAQPTEPEEKGAEATPAEEGDATAAGDVTTAGETPPDGGAAGEGGDEAEATAPGEVTIIPPEMQDDDGTEKLTTDGEDGGEETVSDEYEEGEEGTEEEETTDGEGGEEEDDGEGGQRGSGRKESIRDRLRREGRERARAEDDADQQLPELDSLGQIITPMSVADIPVFTRDDYPDSYSSYTPKEEKLKEHTSRFLAQYIHLYPDRKPPLLNPLNDCDLPKCMSTFIRPSLLPYIDCYDWQGCANFIAEHLDYRPLPVPTEAPGKILSPATVLKYQSANCFELATLLCSLLTGCGYRAFVISGYAVRSVSLRDTIRVACPDMMTGEEPAVEQEEEEENKYTIKPPKDLISKYEAMMAQRIVDAEQKALEEKMAEEIRLMNELEKEPVDPLFGMRVHAWVLVLPGERDITEAFFIEPTVGVGKGIRCAEYLGIESLWNDKNYWINLQYCINGVRDLEYDLYNPAHWEFLLLREAMRCPHPDEVETDLEEATLDADRLVEMPFSWVERLRVSKERYDQRFPCGRKVTNYYRSKLEQYSPYSMKDGVVKRLTIFREFSRENIVTVRESFMHRADHLISREVVQETGWVTEKFSPGREDALREHQFALFGNNPEDPRVMRYYYKARTDCLEKRSVEAGGIIREEFLERDDKLHTRETVVGSIQKKFGPQAAIRKPILCITERFHRNPSGDGDDGVHSRTFDVEEANISVVFHACRGKITAERREFSKPHPDDKARLVPILEEAAASSFTVDPEGLPPRMLELYYMMKAQMEDEEHSVAAVRDAEDEIHELLNTRTQEEAALDTETHLWDSDLTPAIRADRKNLEAFMAEQATRLVEKDKDPLGPFLARMDVPEAEMTVPNRFQLRDECMQSFRQRLVDKANRLQKQFEEETEALQARQRWYQQNYVSLTEEEEEVYLSFCHDTMFRLHVLELLLERHKQMAPVKHQALEMRLRNDPRIAGPAPDELTEIQE